MLARAINYLRYSYFFQCFVSPCSLTIVEEMMTFWKENVIDSSIIILAHTQVLLPLFPIEPHQKRFAHLTFCEKVCLISRTVETRLFIDFVVLSFACNTQFHGCGKQKHNACQINITLVRFNFISLRSKTVFHQATLFFLWRKQTNQSMPSYGIWKPMALKKC